MTILTKTKLVTLSALVLFSAVFFLSPKVEATTPAPNGLYSAHVMNDSTGALVYMQIRIGNNGSDVVLGAGQSNTWTSVGGSQFISCLRTRYTEPDSSADSFLNYLGEFDINAMYTLFKASTIYDTSGNIVNYTFPSAITEIGYGAFKDWKSTSSSSQTLTSVIIPNSVTWIGSDAFAGSSITTVDFSQATNLVDINSSTFNGCTSLNSLDLSNTKITTLQTSTFHYCTSLTSVKLPNTLTEIDNTAFMDTYNLTQLTIPANVNNIHSAAFMDTSPDPKTKILKFTGDFNSSFYDMAIGSNTYVKLLYPAGNPTWENNTSLQALISQGKAASYITSQNPPADISYSAERISTANGVYTFTSSGSYSAFSGIWIHGSAIPSSYYTSEKNLDGSVSITFTNSYARTLTSSEEYLLHFVFNDGFGVLNFSKDEVVTTTPTPDNSSNSVDNSKPALEETEEQQTVNSEIEDASQTQAPTQNSEAIDTVQEQDEGQSGNSITMLIAVLAIMCIGGGALIFVRARKNK